MVETFAPELDRLPWLTDDRAPARKRSGKWLAIALVVLAMAGVAALAFWIGMNRSQVPGEPQATAVPIETAPVAQQPASGGATGQRSPACADAGSRAVASPGAGNFPPATGSPGGDRARSGAPERQAARAFSGSLEARAQRGCGRSEQARRGEEAARLLESAGIRRKRPGGWFVSEPMRTYGRASRPGRGWPRCSRA